MQGKWMCYLSRECGGVGRVSEIEFLLPLYFFLRVLHKWHILSVYFGLSLAFVLIIDLV